MKKYLLFLVCSICGNLSLFSQHTPAAYEIACQDTLLYRQLQLDKVIAPTTDLKLMSKYYVALKQGYKKNTVIANMQRTKPLPLVV